MSPANFLMLYYQRTAFNICLSEKKSTDVNTSKDRLFNSTVFCRVSNSVQTSETEKEKRVLLMGG